MRSCSRSNPRPVVGEGGREPAGGRPHSRESLGHDVDTVADERLAGADDPAILGAARKAGRFLITLDQGFGDVRRYPPGHHPGIAVLRVDSEDGVTVTQAVSSFLSNTELGDLSGCLVVVRGHLARIRCPDQVTYPRTGGWWGNPLTPRSGQGLLIFAASALRWAIC
jgi:predicted nuclease of predicted toxin-antitoxin system